MWPRRLTLEQAAYLLFAILFGIVSVALWIAPYRSQFATVSLIGASVLSSISVAYLFAKFRVGTIHWLGGILYVVFQVNFFIAPRPSLLLAASMIGSAM
ncbi:MAG TPA: hypothetical protein VGQ90_14990, partial [Stellaceae bacterium]|nr:hypothetical protein [Stellaceae bacterium]